MEHANPYQCLDAIRQRITKLEDEVLKRGQFVREAESTIDILEGRCADFSKDRADDMEAIRILKRDNKVFFSDNKEHRAQISELQCAYAEAEAEADRLRKVVDNLHTQIADMITEKREVKPKEAGIHTTDLFWDCNCPKDYINHSYITHCEICGAHSVDQPDSRLEELGMARISGINELAERYARSNK